jgi:hypothetical protein
MIKNVKKEDILTRFWYTLKQTLKSYWKKNQLMIEHWTSLARLTYVIYVYLYSHVVENDNLICCLICTTYMLTSRDQRYITKQFHRYLNLE